MPALRPCLLRVGDLQARERIAQRTNLRGDATLEDLEQGPDGVNPVSYLLHVPLRRRGLAVGPGRPPQPVAAMFSSETAACSIRSVLVMRLSSAS